MKPLIRSLGLLFVVAAAAGAGFGCGGPQEPVAPRERIVRVPAELPSLPSVPQRYVPFPGGVDLNAAPPWMGATALTRTVLPPGTYGSTLTANAKVLVLSADGSEACLGAIRQILDYVGTPYDVWIAADHPGELTASVLQSGSRALYSGVVLTTGTLGYDDATGNWVSALTAAEWNALTLFEAAFGIRQVTWYTYPSPDYGFNWPLWEDELPAITALSATGQQVFARVNTSANVFIRNAWTYHADALPPGTLPEQPDFQPLLLDGDGHVLAAIATYADGRENLAMTFDSNPYLTHARQLAYDTLNWVTRGIFLGERRAYLAAHVDDLFIDDDIWNTQTTYRMSGADLQMLIAWQNGYRTQAQTSTFRLDFAFNGGGTVAGEYVPDTLTPVAKQTDNEFKWINHTWSHENLDTVTKAQARDEIRRNNKLASSWKLKLFDKKNVVTPDVSGLYNYNAMQGLYEEGVRYVVSDTSKVGLEDNPSPNAGRYNALVPGILEVPRHPTNLFYNVSTPQEWVAEYNSIYFSYWGRDMTYQELLDIESERIVSYMLNGDVDPLMFHEANLRAYDGVHSLLGDLLEVVAQKYEALLNPVIMNAEMDGLGLVMSRRMQYDAAGVTMTLGPSNRLTVKATGSALVPITGVRVSQTQVYGGQYISYVPLNAGQTKTFLIPQ